MPTRTLSRISDFRSVCPYRSVSSPPARPIFVTYLCASRCAGCQSPDRVVGLSGRRYGHVSSSRRLKLGPTPN